MSNTTTIAEFLDRGKMGERAANITGADQRDFVAGHLGSLRSKDWWD